MGFSFLKQIPKPAPYLFGTRLKVAPMATPVIFLCIFVPRTGFFFFFFFFSEEAPFPNPGKGFGFRKPGTVKVKKEKKGGVDCCRVCLRLLGGYAWRVG